METRDAHAVPVGAVALELGTDLERGLTGGQVRERLAKLGPNELVERPRPGFAALPLVVIYPPFLQPVFGTVPLGGFEWAVMLALAFLSPIAAEPTKVYLRARPARVTAYRGGAG